MQDKGLMYAGLTSIDGPMIFVENVTDVGYNEVVEIVDPAGKLRLGQVLDVSDKMTAVQVLQGTSGLSNTGTKVRFLGESMKLAVSREMLGRVFDGLGRPLDDCPLPFGGTKRDINGEPINPYSRTYPRDFIQTGISAIDGMNSLVRGQKLPIFSGSGLPHNKIAAQIARQAKLLNEDIEFKIVFAAMGVKNDVAQFFIKNFEDTGVLNNVALFLSLASAPSLERLLTPRSALTLAEHLAFDLDMHVLVILIDMTNYCESLREVGTARGEIPARKGYPGYLYSNLAEIYERAGRIESSDGSITQIPILTMPSDDISHPVPDLTGYITEGQIVLDRELSQKSVYPPIAGLPSLSRLMKDGIGKGFTREDHPQLAAQLFAAYSKVKDIRNLAAVIGEEELSPLDKTYMQFGQRFEEEFLNQGEYENRMIETTLSMGWEMLSILPRNELVRINEDFIDEYYKVEKKKGESSLAERQSSDEGRSSNEEQPSDEEQTNGE